MVSPLIIGKTPVGAGERRRIDIQTAPLYDGTHLSIPVEVVRGRAEGPTLFISAAIHGDEIIGTEIISRLLRNRSLEKLKGTLIAIPVVNVFGFNQLSRYLPDRRDLNRSFPGSATGSLASRLAHTLMTEVVRKCSHGIDLHTGAIHRENFPQIRASLDDPETKRLAFEFGVPLILNSRVRDGSLREAARRRKISILIFEGGEALRVDERVIQIGLKGCLSVMRAIGMLPKKKHAVRKEAFISWQSQWVRAPQSGMIRSLKNLGSQLKEGELIGTIADPFGKKQTNVISPVEGIVIGQLRLPLVNAGDAIYNIASFLNAHQVKKNIDRLEEYMAYFYD